MTITTKGRYALRVMLDLAAAPEGENVSLQEIAARQEISLKYLEALMMPLSAAGLVRGTRGKFGGYRIARPADSISVGSVLTVADGDLAPVACLAEGAPPCPRAGCCKTLPFWQGLDRVIREYAESKTLADLL